MIEEPWYARKEREAAERVAAELAKPFDDGSMNSGDYFDPWSLFPALYGSYSSEFDVLAVEVLTDLQNGTHERRDLAAEMFREMLCTSHLCDYGTSPRVCFPTHGHFKPLIPQLIEKWKAYYAVRWSQEYGA